MIPIALYLCPEARDLALVGSTIMAKNVEDFYRTSRGLESIDDAVRQAEAAQHAGPTVERVIEYESPFVASAVDRRSVESDAAGGVVVRRDVRDVRVDALVDMLAGRQSPYSGIREAFDHITGAADRGRPVWPEEWQQLMIGNSFGGYDTRDLESISSPGSWAAMFGDAIHKRLTEEYNTTPGLQGWRHLVSTQRFKCDFREQLVERIGGYGIIPTVNPGAPYQPLTTPAEGAESSYVVTKRGGVESVTYEAWANNDTRFFQRIPKLLARAAANTLNRAVFDTLVTNPLMFDGVALFDAAHANTAAVPLSATSLAAARLAMRKQRAFGDTAEALGVVPRFLYVVPELEELAIALCALYRPCSPTSASLSTPMDVVVIPHLTSTTAWWIGADPRTVETIEVGFTADDNLPSIGVSADDPNGEGFSTDQIFFSVRHHWGLTTVDHRGLYRGNS